MAPLDAFQRPLRDLRISVTDRCNFRCPYCMPKEVFGPGYAFLPEAHQMSFDEIVRLARVFLALGVEKIRLTGGEPLLRPRLPELVQRLKREAGVPDLALTTNAWLLEKQAAALREAGLDRLNVSVDSLEDATAGRMNGQGLGAARVLRGIDAAAELGIPLKVNVVMQRGVNEHELIPIAGYFRERGHPVRFIEFMDVGHTNHWAAAQVLPAREIVARLSTVWPLEPLEPAYRGEVAARYRYRDGRGEIGLISSITEPFCRDCHRARLSADGRLFTCLFTARGWDVLGRLRAGGSDVELQALVARIWGGRSDRYSDERAELLARGEARPKAEMSYLGG